MLHVPSADVGTTSRIYAYRITARACMQYIIIFIDVQLNYIISN